MSHLLLSWTSGRGEPVSFLQETRQLQLLHFGLFRGIYLAALLGNGLILTAIACDHRLHTPMYFFLLNLSLLDLGEFFLLTIMACDHYITICKPLHYGTIMDSRTCVNMTAAAWGCTILYAVLHTANTFTPTLCQGNVLEQFFCDIPQILKLSCSDAYLREVRLLVVSFCIAFVCFVLILFSYVQIFRAVLRIPSEQGRNKAFSTCLPHLAVVSLFISTGTFTYVKPHSMSSSSLNLLLAVLDSVIPPVLNPIIFSMRNQELKDAVSKVMTGCFSKGINCLSSAYHS
ncbi:olfactory receptor 14A16-like [Oxyura jamaicensis]|uniref:olfactory receptor 14A16-like n=1 Tax=Oxyura jamaicensis TaxID=8884 RepID=UPI0015A5824A|nr:olfactory receptor 14A16-like [Oxyura jamaicensis]